MHTYVNIELDLQSIYKFRHSLPITCSDTGIRPHDLSAFRSQSGNANHSAILQLLS